jgi:hypothetical protein
LSGSREERHETHTERTPSVRGAGRRSGARHQACDKSDNIDEQSLDRNSDAIGYAVWQLAGIAA